jgi:hypothetical protein
LHVTGQRWEHTVELRGLSPTTTIRRTLAMKPLALTLLLTASSLAYADCVTYQGGLTECNGPRGYQSSQREYQGGMAESWDNQGNRATIQRHTGGYTSVTAPTGIAPSVSSAPSPGYSGGRGGGINPGSRIVPSFDPFAR